MLRRVAPAAVVGGASVVFLSTWLMAETRTVEKPMFNGNRLAWCASWDSDCGKPAAEAWCLAQGFAGAEAFVQAPDIGSKSPTRLIATGAICDSADCDGFKEITCRMLDPASPGSSEAAAPPPPPVPRPATEEEAAAPAAEEAATVAVADASVVPDPVPAPEPEPAAEAAAAVPPGEPDAESAPAGATADAPAAAAQPTEQPAAEAEVVEEDDGPPPPDVILLAAAGAPPIRPVLEVFTAPKFEGRRLDWCRGWKDACGKATADEFCRLNGFVEAQSFAPDPKIGAAEPTRQIASGLVCDHEGCDGFAEIACMK